MPLARALGPPVGELLRGSRERVCQIESATPHKLRRLDGERLYAYYQELSATGAGVGRQGSGIGD